MESKTPSSLRLKIQEIESNGSDFIRIILDDSHVDLDFGKVEKLYRFLMLFVKRNQNVRDSSIY